ncbi:PDF receptor isoform X2 [Onthophagus taurus]|uniref:PDF receptor isoform X2 n=2 Tax=Onthophagus taurus TaxID=166361 RepID=UPI000C20EB2A|nr:PDF receptor isoform X2 [Onthophagus taurus]
MRISPTSTIIHYFVTQYLMEYYAGHRHWLEHQQINHVLVKKELAFRTCLINGKWESNNFTKDTSNGYTNYENCVPPHGRDLFKMCREMDECIEIIEKTRIIEFVGLFLSVFSLVISLIIFYRYRVLRNNRTTIHKNLFLATTIQMTTRLCFYIDHSFGMKGIKETEYLCEACIILLEYTKTAMFMWMFIEGLYLHNVITVAVFQEHFYIKLYFYLGWGVPLFIVTIWTLVMLFSVVNTGCWFLYNFMPHYWILEGPRYTVIILNMIFLLNIIRVLVVKLRKSKTSEIVQVRKAVRAAIFLLPLMGIANILFIVDYKLFKKAWKFALWCYTTYFITTFQGFFVAVLYCFLNEEVRTAVSHSFSIYMMLRKDKKYANRGSVVDTNLTALGYSDQ